VLLKRRPLFRVIKRGAILPSYSNPVLRTWHFATLKPSAFVLAMKVIEVLAARAMFPQLRISEFNQASTPAIRFK